MKNELLCRLYETSINQIRLIIDIVKSLNVTNDQKFLDYLDQINELSVEF